MTKHKCICGHTTTLTKYRIHLEGSLTFRDYHDKCPSCGKELEVRDLNESDLKEQEYLC